jgi:hypothetical protein
VKQQASREREFEEIEKDFKAFFSMDFGTSQEDRIKGRDITGTLIVTFEESCHGCIKPF